MHSKAERSQRGAATVEAAAGVAVLAVVVAVLLQIVLVADAALSLGHAAREGARAAALGEGDTLVRSLVATLAGVAPSAVTIDPPGDRDAGEIVEVGVSGSVVRLPVLEAMLPELRLSASASARVELDP